MIVSLRSFLLLTFGLILAFNSSGFDVDAELCPLVLLDGCTDVTACNYVASATTDDGSCEYLSCLVGCMDEDACNFNPDALYPNNGTCNFTTCAGCMDATACNFDEDASIAVEAACVYTCFGCSDFTACNFDPNADFSSLTNCVYAIPNFDCEGNPTGCDGCEPILISDASDQFVECTDELPLIFSESMEAISSCSEEQLSVAVFTADIRDSVIVNAGFTGDGAGTDGAIRIFGLTALGLSESDFFIESYPLILTRFTNGLATLTGEVTNELNPNLKWSVHLTFEDAQIASEWLDADEAHGLVIANGCELNPEQVSVYRLKADQSFLIGQGGYADSYLQLSHMPLNENKRFQLGVGANSSTCSYGFGGWFAWEGRVLGVPVFGMTGDVVIDLSSDGVNTVPCGSESTAHFFSTLNPACGLLTEAVQTFYRMDESSPIWTGNCAAEITLCALDGEEPEIPLPCTAAFEDACEDPLSLSFSEALISGDTLNGNAFVLERTHSAQDCSGNTGVFIQTITYLGEQCPEQSELTAFESDDVHHASRFQQRSAVDVSDERTHNDPDLTLHPNPGNGWAFLDWTSQNTGPVTIEVFHADGTFALEPIICQMNSHQKQRVQLNGGVLNAGTYFVRIRSNLEFQVIPWVIIR